LAVAAGVSRVEKAVVAGVPPANWRGLHPTRLPLQKVSSGLSWRAFVVRQNFSNCRRKVLDPGTRHDDAVPAAMSFFSDAQESPALVLSELYVEMLALNLQFSRLDDVIHFLLKAPTLPHSFWGMEEKSAGFVQILWSPGYGWPPCDWHRVQEL
jgi:hypothetical protein